MNCRCETCFVLDLPGGRQFLESHPQGSLLVSSASIALTRTRTTEHSTRFSLADPVVGFCFPDQLAATSRL